MNQYTRHQVAAGAWMKFARQLPIAITNEGEVVAYLVPSLDNLIDISDYPPLMKQKVLAIRDLVNAVK